MNTKLTIRNLRARPVLVPFRRPPVAASGAMPDCALVLIDLETDEGITGRSYVFGFMPWTLKPIVGSHRRHAGDDQRRCARAVRDRRQAAQAPHAVRHAGHRRPRARRHRHVRVGCAGTSGRRAAGEVARRRGPAGARLQQQRPVDSTAGDARRRSRATGRRRRLQRGEAAHRARRSARRIWRRCVR